MSWREYFLSKPTTILGDTGVRCGMIDDEKGECVGALDDAMVQLIVSKSTEKWGAPHHVRIANVQ